MPSDPPPSEEPPTDPPPAPATRAPGSVAVGQAAYPVPSGAVVVSPTGSDSAPGTLAAPVRTLATAIARTPAGGTVVMRAGVYHESVTASRTITVQAYPSEAVWLDGSSVVTGWSADGSTFVHGGWTTEFDSTVNSSAINSSYPLAGHPDQMWVDGVELTQVGSAAAVTATSFYADYANNQLVIGRNPAGREVRAADLSTALTLKGTGSIVRGIGVRRYGNSMKDLGALRLYAKNIVAENVVVSGNGVIGAFLASTGITLRNVTLEGNGMLGANANYADGISLQGVLARGNNTEHFNRSPVSGGVKITRTRGIQVRGSEFSANDGPGLWLDESCYDSMITGNRMVDNLGHGLSLEISDTATLADNVVTNNVGNGFKINDSGNVKIWNNTFGSNKNNVALAQDNRRGWRASDPGHDPRQAQPDPTMPWLVRNVVVANNVLSAPLAGGYSVWVGDGSGEFSGADMNLRIDGNRFVKSSGTAVMLWTPTKGRTTSYSSTSQYTASTGDGRSNVEVGTTYASPSTASGLPLPTDVAAQIDRPDGSRHVGAY